ncbi:MAG: Rv1355c family protein [Bacteroidia bacterium]
MYSEIANIYKPELLNLLEPNGLKRFEELTSGNNTLVFDTIHHQLTEYIKCINPKTKFTKEELNTLATQKLGADAKTYGTWVYYPWSKRLVHVLPEEEFTELRTNRNCYKITPEERFTLSTKIIGVVGLSVGQSIALTLAMERSFGELRLADFDTLDLSNLNRIRAGVYNLGLNKAIITAREIYEIDPYLNVVCYTNGLTEENIDDFFSSNGKLDILIDECDGLDIKILARHKAKSMGIPVFMDTSDRGMVDIERFDLEPERPLLHGLVGDLEPQKLKGLTNEQKVPYILPMIGYENISTRLKASMMEIEESISTWPQLASSVVLGGGVGADITRKILLGQSTVSGRFYIDLDDIIPEPKQSNIEYNVKPNPYKPLDKEMMDNLLVGFEQQVKPSKKLSTEQIEEMVEKACTAPSGGNCQPWKWYVKNNVLFLFHDKFQSYSLLDYNHNGSMVALGSAIENLELFAATKGIKANFIKLKQSNNDYLMGYFVFEDAPSKQSNNLAQAIGIRETNRLLKNIEPIEKNLLTELISIACLDDGYNVLYLSHRDSINKLTGVLGAIERIRLLHPQGHEDFINEIRWTEEENLAKRNGVDLATVDLTASEIAGLKLAKDYKPLHFLNKLQKGKTFEKMMKKTLDTAPVVGLLTAPPKTDFLDAGKMLERVWLAANYLGLAFHPVSPSTFMFKRFETNSFEGFEKYMIEEMIEHHKALNKLFNLNDDVEKVFLFKLFKSKMHPKKSLRKPLKQVLIIN